MLLCDHVLTVVSGTAGTSRFPGKAKCLLQQISEPTGRGGCGGGVSLRAHCVGDKHPRKAKEKRTILRFSMPCEKQKVSAQNALLSKTLCRCLSVGRSGAIDARMVAAVQRELSHICPEQRAGNMTELQNCGVGGDGRMVFMGCVAGVG